MSKPRKPKHPLSKKMQRAFDVVCAGGSYKVAALEAGASVRHVHRTMKRPEVRALLQGMAVDTIAFAAPRAAQRLVSLMQQDEARKVSLDASVHVLAVQNIRPPHASVPAVNVNIGVAAMSSGFTLAGSMLPEERREIEEQWREAAAHGAPGYIIRVKDRHNQLGPLRQPAIEHAPRDRAPEPEQPKRIVTSSDYLPVGRQIP